MDKKVKEAIKFFTDRNFNILSITENRFIINNSEEICATELVSIWKRCKSLTTTELDNLFKR